MTTHRIVVQLDNGQRRTVNVAGETRADAVDRAAQLMFGKRPEHHVVKVERP